MVPGQCRAGCSIPGNLRFAAFTISGKITRQMQKTGQSVSEGRRTFGFHRLFGYALAPMDVGENVM